MFWDIAISPRVWQIWMRTPTLACCFSGPNPPSKRTWRKQSVWWVMCERILASPWWLHSYVSCLLSIALLARWSAALLWTRLTWWKFCFSLCLGCTSKTVPKEYVSSMMVCTMPQLALSFQVPLHYSMADLLSPVIRTGGNKSWLGHVSKFSFVAWFKVDVACKVNIHSREHPDLTLGIAIANWLEVMMLVDAKCQNAPAVFMFFHITICFKLCLISLPSPWTSAIFSMNVNWVIHSDIICMQTHQADCFVHVRFDGQTGETTGSYWYPHPNLSDTWKNCNLSRHLQSGHPNSTRGFVPLRTVCCTHSPQLTSCHFVVFDTGKMAYMTHSFWPDMCEGIYFRSFHDSIFDIFSILHILKWREYLGVSWITRSTGLDLGVRCHTYLLNPPPARPAQPSCQARSPSCQARWTLLPDPLNPPARPYSFFSMILTSRACSKLTLFWTCWGLWSHFQTVSAVHIVSQTFLYFWACIFAVYFHISYFHSVMPFQDRARESCANLAQFATSSRHDLSRIVGHFLL